MLEEVGGRRVKLGRLEEVRVVKLKEVGEGWRDKVGGIWSG